MGMDTIRQYITRFRGYFASLTGADPVISAPSTASVVYDADRQALLVSENAGLTGRFTARQSPPSPNRLGSSILRTVRTTGTAPPRPQR